MIWVLGFLLLVACSAAGGPEVVTLDDQGLTLKAKGGQRIPWADIEALQLDSHLVSEQESAPLLVVTVKGQPVQVCAAYPRRVDPQSYAGMHDAISVGKESFLALRDTITSAAALEADPKVEGRWVKSKRTPNLTVEPATFAHGYAAP